MSCKCTIPTRGSCTELEAMGLRGFEGWCYGHQLMHERLSGKRAPCICGEHGQQRQLVMRL